jgi:hypothetical protein
VRSSGLLALKASPSTLPGLVRCSSDSMVGALSGTLRQSEVQNLRLTEVRDEYVCWLYVPINDSSGMCCVQGIRDLDTQIDRRNSVIIASRC